MERHVLVVLKIYLGSVLDVLLFGLAAWDGLDHVLRTISAAGAVLVLFYLIRKYNQDYRLKKVEEEIKRLQLEKERQWFEEKFKDK